MPKLIKKTNSLQELTSVITPEIHVKFKSISSEELSKRNIPFSDAHKYAGEELNIAVFDKKDYKQALQVISEAANPITKLSQVAWACPKQLGLAVCNFEHAQAEFLAAYKSF